MTLTTNEDEAINTIFSDINDVYTCSKRAIITGSNKVVDALNKKILKLLHGDTVVTLHGVTRLAGRRSEVKNLLTPEYLISLTSQGVATHKLKLKLNCLCMVSRNISVEDWLMNNTKVIVRDISRHLITVEILPQGRRLVIPRIVFRFTMRSGLVIEQRQFPSRLSYVITVNKSQGQTLNKVCFDLREPPFAHRQLYVGASRVRIRQDILVFTWPEHLENNIALTKNNIYRELLPPT